MHLHFIVVFNIFLAFIALYGSYCVVAIAYVKYRSWPRHTVNSSAALQRLSETKCRMDRNDWQQVSLSTAI